MNKQTEEIESNLEKLIAGNVDVEALLKEIVKLPWEAEKEKWLKSIAKVKKVSLAALKRDLNKTESKVKSETEKTKIDNSEEKFTDGETQKAKELLTSPNILERMLDLADRAGYIGETIIKTMLYLVLISRLFDEAISCVIKGPSSVGKSALAALILKFILRKHILETTILTPKAMYHYEETLSHKILYIHEHEGAQNAEYPIRVSLSERKLIIMVPIKDEITGNFKTVRKEIEANGLAVIQTTTQQFIHPENETRLFSLIIEDSKEQTAKVIRFQAQTAKGETIDKQELEKEFRIWRCASDMLEPLEVIIPFADQLAPIFPTEDLRVRRDFPKVLVLIKTHALLYQMQRKRQGGKIVAEYKDLEGVKELIFEILRPSLNELSRNQMVVLERIKESFDLTVQKEYSLNELHEKVQDAVSYSTMKNYVKFYHNLGFIIWNKKSGAGSAYKLSPLANKAIVGSKLLNSLNNLVSELAKQDLANPSQTANAKQAEGEFEESANGIKSDKADLANDIHHCFNNDSNFNPEVDPLANRPKGDETDASYSQDLPDSRFCKTSTSLLIPAAFFLQRQVA